MEILHVGKMAPDFELPDQQGERVRLSDFRNKKIVVLYFYPKDETPGCVREACAFRDQYEIFQQYAAEVIGISADSVRSHKKFVEKRRLPFILLSDRDKSVSKAYGVKGSLMGLLPGRETFVIDKEGVIQHHFSSQFQAEKHIEEALEVVKQIVDR
ncbi:MAG: peroxiredoxin [Bacteroidota bacterium]